MAKFAPHHSLYKIIDIIRGFSDGIFWTIFILSVLPTLAQYFYPHVKLDDLFNAANVVCIFLFFVLDIVVDYGLMPQADSKRRDDFIDNSFGSKFSPNNSVEYFDNEEIGAGLYKAAVNLFENCFFSLSLINHITARRIIRPALVFVTVWVIAYFGFKTVPFGLAILQVLFSTTILGNLIRHLMLQSKLNSIQESLIALFQNSDFSIHPENYQPDLFRNWLKYETLHTKIPANVPKKVFEELNLQLTAEWKNLKLKYNIH